MSKKNNRHTRERAHQFAKRREQEAIQKKAQKAEKKQQAEQREAVKTGILIARAGSASPVKPGKMGFSAPGVAGKKFKRKGIRLRKNSMVRGIRIEDASSRQKVKEILAAEEAMKEMMVDDETSRPAEETMKEKKPTLKKKTAGKGKDLKKKKTKKAGEKSTAMTVE